MNPLPEKITIGEKYRQAMKITDQVEADAYFELCVEHNMARGTSREEAESIERQNLGYYAGYFDQETMARVNRLFRTAHPIFGSVTPAPREAFEAGRRSVESAA